MKDMLRLPQKILACLFICCTSLTLLCALIGFCHIIPLGLVSQYDVQRTLSWLRDFFKLMRVSLLIFVWAVMVYDGVISVK